MCVFSHLVNHKLIIMRILIQTTASSSKVNFNYQQKLVGCLHKWIGAENTLHGVLSLYSFSWLQDGKMINNELSFSRGARLFISSYDEDRIKDIVRSILKQPEMFCGMEVKDVSLIPDPDLSSRELFFLGSPIFLHYRENESKHYKQYTYQDAEAQQLMTDILKHKMEIAGLPKDESLSVRFDLSYDKKHTKLMTYKGIKNKASMCPVIIKGTNQSKQFAWNVGIGNSTGIGFGSIY